MAPEVLNPSSDSFCDASKADIWSFGITLIELLRGKPPLYYLSPRAAMATIPHTSPPRIESDDPRASKTLRELIHSCLHDDPMKRPSASQLLKSFKSYFKQQKSTIIPGSLSRLKSNNEIGSYQDREHRPLSGKTSETIYSQWDFDLSTIKGNFEDETSFYESKNAESDKESIIEDEKDHEDENYNDNTTNLEISEDTNDQELNILKDINLPSGTGNQFRKLVISENFNNNKSNGWDTKDTSILPIPCPSDAPDPAGILRKDNLF